MYANPDEDTESYYKRMRPAVSMTLIIPWPAPAPELRVPSNLCYTPEMRSP